MLFCLRTVAEAMERLLLDRFLEEEEVESPDPVALLCLSNRIKMFKSDIYMSKFQYMSKL